jgi:uncharacterized protein (DUF952 family)
VLIYKIVHAGEWEERRDPYAGSPKDQADGFLHFSTADQVAGTLARYYANERGLILVAVESEALGTALKFEASTGGALFPHLYAPLPLSAVVWARELKRDETGAFVLPL